jgi:hypothetical protein
MKVSSQQLVDELSLMLDPTLVRQAIESYGEVQQRFLGGDWGPAELNGGRLCEAVSRCLYQMDTGRVSHSKSVGEIRKHLLDDTQPHNLSGKDRYHIAKVVEVVYKFRSDRGAVHISPVYNANYMDSMLILHSAKWILAEFLRLAWNKDEEAIAATIAQLVQLEHSLIHELDGQPLVLARGISAPEEVLLLLNHAPNNRLTRLELQKQVANQKPQNVSTAVARLIDRKDIRPLDDEVALTPNGQHRIIVEILPKLTGRK